MKYYYKQTLRNPLDYFILLVGTNDLVSDQTSEEMASSIYHYHWRKNPKKWVCHQSYSRQMTNDSMRNCVK